MNLPTEPTILPDARRYPRTFSADDRVTYKAESVIKIQIPPIPQSYLTKNNFLEFKFNLKYKSGTDAEYKHLTQMLMGGLIGPTPIATMAELERAYNFMGATLVLPGNEPTYNYNVKSSNILNHAMPYFDTNGAHGLFKNLKVYDYLGTTLLEEIDGYDVVTALFHHEDRPRFTTDYGSIKVPPGVSAFSPFEFYNFASTTRPSTINATITKDAEGDYIVDDLNVKANELYLTDGFTIPLYSFLNRLSDKFVPLHNGFTLQLVVNDPNACIALSNPYIANLVYYDTAQYPLTPSITDFFLNDVKLVCDILEIPKELDSQVVKEIHTRSFLYQKGVTKLLRQVKSLTQCFVQRRPLPTTILPWSQRLAFRVFVGCGKLTYNDAILKEFKTPQEAWEESRPLLEPTIDIDDFTNGSTVSGPQVYPISRSQLVSWQNSGTTIFTGTVGGKGYYDVTTSANVPVDRPDLVWDSSIPRGQFVEPFDLRLPGTTEKAVTGIDTSRAVLEYKGPESKDTVLEIIGEFDAFIKIEPGISSSLAF